MSERPTAATWLLSRIDDPPERILWMRPARSDEAPADVVVRVDLGAAPGGRDRGVVAFGVGVRWPDEPRSPRVATWIVREDWTILPEGDSPRLGGWGRWLKELIRDYRRRADQRGITFVGTVLLPEPRAHAHAPRDEATGPSPLGPRRPRRIVQ